MCTLKSRSRDRFGLLHPKTLKEIEARARALAEHKVLQRYDRVEGGSMNQKIVSMPQPALEPPKRADAIIAARRGRFSLQEAVRLSGQVAGAYRYDKDKFVQFYTQHAPDKIAHQVPFSDEDGDPLFQLRNITLDELNATDWLPIDDGSQQAVA